MHDHGISTRIEQHEQELPTHEGKPRDGIPQLNKCNMTWHEYDAPNAIYCKQRKKKKLLYRQATAVERTTVLGRSDRRTKRKGNDVVPLMGEVDNITISSGATRLLIKE